MTDDRQEAARRGERGRASEGAAAAWLEGQGYRVIDRNHRSRRGEVDLVCEEGEVLCFVEVRSRASDLHGTPAESVDRTKALKVVRAAGDWALLNDALDRQIRFDVVSVLTEGGAPAFELIRAAFDSNGDTRLW